MTVRGQAGRERISFIWRPLGVLVPRETPDPTGCKSMWGLTDTHFRVVFGMWAASRLEAMQVIGDRLYLHRAGGPW